MQNTKQLTPKTVNMARLASMLGPNAANMNPQIPSTMSSLKFTIGRRTFGANESFTAMPMTASGNGNVGAAGGMQVQLVNGRLQFQGVTTLDGEYVILIPMADGVIGETKGGNGTQNQFGGAFEQMSGASGLRSVGLSWAVFVGGAVLALLVL